MPSIFISYRRSDSEGEAGRLYDDLVSRFGASCVFMDVSALEIGEDFRKGIDRSVATCNVLLAVVGKDWLDSKNEKGERRLDDPADFVRLEIGSALQRGIPVIPVLVRGAKVPPADLLSADLRELAYRNAVELTHARWGSDLQILTQSLQKHVEPPPQPAPPSPPLPEVVRPPVTTSSPWLMRGMLLFAVLCLASLGFFFTRRPPPPAAPFARTWEPVHVVFNGTPQKFKPQPLSVNQVGNKVIAGNREFKVTGNNSATSPVSPDPNQVDTFTLRLEGDSLVLQADFDYKTQVGTHAPGKGTRVTTYRRLAQ